MMRNTKGLRETFIFQQMNGDGYIDKRVALFTDPKTSFVVTPNRIEEQMMRITKTFKYPLKNAVLEAYRNGALVPVMLNKGVEDRMPSAIPFIVNNNHSRALVFIHNNATVNGNGDVEIDHKKLYCLLESAYIALMGINVNNSSLINKGGVIWAHLFTKVLNKKFSLNTDKSALNKVTFIASKYYLHNLLGMKDETTTFNYALKNCRDATDILVRDIDSEFTIDTYENIATFLTKLANLSFKLVAGFENITVRDFIASYAEMYGQSTILALESVDYFVYMMSSVIIGAYLNNQTILEDIIDMDGARLYFEIGGR